jgi:hypothetical protein
MKMANYIEGKLEEFRLSGKVPAKWIGLSVEAFNQLENELRPMLRNGEDKDARLTDFLGMVLIPMSGPMMPDDGVYIHDANSPREEHPFAKKRNF